MSNFEKSLCKSPTFLATNPFFFTFERFPVIIANYLAVTDHIFLNLVPPSSQLR